MHSTSNQTYLLTGNCKIIKINHVLLLFWEFKNTVSNFPLPKFPFHGNISSIESNINMCMGKAGLLSTIYQPSGNLITDKINQKVFQVVAMLALLYNYIIRTLTKSLEKKLNGNYTRMPNSVLDKSWKQHPTKQLYDHFPSISQIIQVKWTRYVGYC